MAVLLAILRSIMMMAGLNFFPHFLAGVPHSALLSWICTLL